jgi:hypothetical protein
VVEQPAPLLPSRIFIVAQSSLIFVAAVPILHYCAWSANFVNKEGIGNFPGSLNDTVRLPVQVGKEAHAYGMDGREFIRRMAGGHQEGLPVRPPGVRESRKRLWSVRLSIESRCLVLSSHNSALNCLLQTLCSSKYLGRWAEEKSSNVPACRFGGTEPVYLH